MSKYLKNGTNLLLQEDIRLIERYPNRNIAPEPASYDNLYMADIRPLLNNNFPDKIDISIKQIMPHTMER